MASDDGALLRLLDERAIAEVLARYCRGIDRMDRELVRSCYHADATDEHGRFRGGVEEFLDWVFPLLSTYTSTMHFLGNRLIEWDPAGGDHRARVETYGIAFHRTEGGTANENLVTGFRYVDRFERRDVGGPATEWRIAGRVAVTEWVSVDGADRHWPIAGDLLRGARDRTDPVYAPWDDPPL